MFVNRNRFVNTSALVQQATDEQGTEERQVPIMDGEALAEHARSLGAKAGEASDTAIQAVMKAKEEWQGGAFRVLIGLQSDYTEEQLNEFAIPDTEDGNNPDVFKVSKEDGKGKTKMVNTTFYTQFADSTPAGQNILARLEWCHRAGDAAMIKDDVPQDILDMTPHEREVHINFLNGRRTTIRQSYKKAMALYFQFNAVNDYPGIMAEPIWIKGKSPSDTDAPEVENTTKPIAVWQVPEEGRPIAKWEALSIGAFMKLNPKRGLEKGGTFSALIESGATKKAPGGGSQTDNNDGFVIKTLDKGVAVIAELHRWIEEIGTEKDKATVAKLFKLGNTKDNDEFVVAVFELADFLNHMVKETGIGQKYLKLQQGSSDLVQQATDKGKAA